MPEQGHARRIPGIDLLSGMYTYLPTYQRYVGMASVHVLVSHYAKTGSVMKVLGKYVNKGQGTYFCLLPNVRRTMVV